MIGVDDDELACELSEVPLSSVAQPLMAIGQEAARLLRQTMEHPRQAPPSIVLTPLRVVVRASSDTVAIANQDVAQALRLIRDHAAEPINVEWLIERLPVSRPAMAEGHPPSP